MGLKIARGKRRRAVSYGGCLTKDFAAFKEYLQVEGYY